MRFSHFLIILSLAVFWYGLVPMVGAFISRHGWRVFRRRFDDLRLKPFLDYASCLDGAQTGNGYRFIGSFESTDGSMLWIRSETLTMPVMLEGAHTYILPMSEGDEILEDFDPRKEVPEKIRWDRVTVLTEGAKVFVGGALVQKDDRRVFVSTAEQPLLIIFYDGNDRSLTIRTIRAGRNKNEYWNTITPYAFIGGTFCQFMVALHFLSRPIFRFTVISACIALFTPLVPLFPPGVLFTVLYRRLWWRARVFRSYRDILQLPLKYMSSGVWDCRLPDGERYGAVYYDALPGASLGNKIPLLIPEKRGQRRPEQNKTALKKEGWYVFGRIPEGVSAGTPIPRALSGEDLPEFPREPRDLFAPFGAVLGNPEILARTYTQKAYMLEILSCILLLAGVGLNIFLIIKILLVVF